MIAHREVDIMQIQGELLYHYLCERYSVSRLGKNLLQAEFSLPLFYEPETKPERGKAYIVRARELPKNCAAECLFLCIGGRPALPRGGCEEMVFYLEEPELDLLSLSNHVGRFYDRVSSWNQTMQELLNRGAALEALVSASLPLFENCITITDYKFSILVNCGLCGEGAGRRVEVIHDYDRVPEEIVATFWSDSSDSARRREPFTFKGQRENPEGENYCINLYLGSSYYGTCTLWNKLRPMNARDKLLFAQFAEFIKQHLSSQPGPSGHSGVTLKSIFSDLIHAFPASGQDLEWAVDLVKNNLHLTHADLGEWQILAIRSANRNKALPAEYICASLEDMLTCATAVVLEEQIVCLCPIPKGESSETTICDILLPYLADMNFQMGLSAPFTDLFRARSHYLQASDMLETGRRYAPEQRIYRFEDYILPYMLRHSWGELENGTFLTSGLKELLSLDSTVDYQGTLRLYLDNECNASKTAQDLYLHRSSLLPRLDKIRSLVDMDTPEQRLYLRMCLTLLELEKTRKKPH